MLWLLILPLLIAGALVWALNGGKLKNTPLQAWWDEQFGLDLPDGQALSDAAPDAADDEPRVWQNRSRATAEPPAPEPPPVAPAPRRSQWEHAPGNRRSHWAPPEPEPDTPAVAATDPAPAVPAPEPVILPQVPAPESAPVAALPQVDLSELSRAVPRYIRKRAEPAPASSGKLPVIGLDEVQRNLRDDVQRRQKLEASERRVRRQPTAPAKPALPLIDPNEVRASLQQLHGKRDNHPPPPKPTVVLQPTPVMRKPSITSRRPEPPRSSPPGSPRAAAGTAKPVAAPPPSPTIFPPLPPVAASVAKAVALAAGSPVATPVAAVVPPSFAVDPATLAANLAAPAIRNEPLSGTGVAAPASGLDWPQLSDVPDSEPVVPVAPFAEARFAPSLPDIALHAMHQQAWSHYDEETDSALADDAVVAAPALPDAVLPPAITPLPDASSDEVTDETADRHPLHEAVQPVAASTAPAKDGGAVTMDEPVPETYQAADGIAPADTVAPSVAPWHDVAASPAAAPAARAAHQADVVWHLLEDEPEAEAVPLASPLVWQLLDEPAAAANPVVPATLAAAPAAPKPHSVPVVYGDACLPSLALLRPPESDKAVQSEDYLIERGILIEEKCAEFKVKVAVVDAYAGPVITRYEVEPAVGVRGSQVVNLAKDLSRALGVASIRVVETIPGKTCMGLELPNPKRQMIRLSEIFSAEVFQHSASKLTLALGQDISGAPVVMDLAKAPHLLVAGTTGSGKSVGVNAMILSMLYKATPDEVRFIMIDPKMLELSVYNDIPHLLAPVVTDMKLAANALNWCVGEMEKRYRLMSHLGVRNLAGYNDKVRAAEARGQRLTNPFSLTPETPEPLATLPFIVVVVDEFADLMMVAGKKIEELIARLAQKARAAGIHLILATQRPSVDVITGLIKANIPTRIAFQVSSKIDSRTILDQMGAESLLGQGDMLYLPPGTGYPQRVHGAFVTDEEVHAIVEDLKQWGEPDYVEGLLTGESVADDEQADAKGRAAAASETDPLYDEAVEIVLRTRKASISSVQRQLRIGYNRAARLIEDMEAAGIVSSMENNGNRTVLVPQRGDY